MIASQYIFLLYKTYYSLHIRYLCTVNDTALKFLPFFNIHIVARPQIFDFSVFSVALFAKKVFA